MNKIQIGKNRERKGKRQGEILEIINSKTKSCMLKKKKKSLDRSKINELTKLKVIFIKHTMFLYLS